MKLIDLRQQKLPSREKQLIRMDTLLIERSDGKSIDAEIHLGG